MICGGYIASIRPELPLIHDKSLDTERIRQDPIRDCGRAVAHSKIADMPDSRFRRSGYQYRLPVLCRLFPFPQILKQLNRRGGVPTVVVVSERKNLQDFLVTDHRFEHLHPVLEVIFPVNDGLVPGLRLLLDSFSVAKPAHVREISRHQIELLFQFPRSRYPTLVDQCQRYAVLIKQDRETGIHPIFVPNLDGELMVLGKFPQERCQPGQKVSLGLERFLIEVTKLEEQRPEFIAQGIHRFEEVFEIVITVNEHFLVRYDLRHFRREDETRGRLRVPALHRRESGRAIKRVVQFNGVEFRGVIR
jgi:hypothetical protein